MLHTKFNEVLMKTCNNWHGACSTGLDQTSSSDTVGKGGEGGEGEETRKGKGG